MKRNVALSALAVAIVMFAGTAWAAQPAPAMEPAQEDAAGVDILPETALEEAPELTPEPVPMTDCYSLSTCTTSFAECESWCYGQGCGIDSWNSGTQMCYCGYKM